MVLSSPDAVLTETLAIALVDDDSLFRESVEQNLLDCGYAVRPFPSGPAFLEALEGGTSISLVLLDWKMPEMNGIEVLKRLRSLCPEVPVIFLTVLGEQIYEEAALQGGAVDFVEKSRSFGILRRRIELIRGGQRGGGPPTGAGALIANVNAGANAGAGVGGGRSIILGALQLDAASHRATWQAHAVTLSLTEFKIVNLLALNAGRDISYRDIYDLVHGAGFQAGEGQDGYRTNVRAFMKRIRQKFRDVDPLFDGIHNYPGFGYRWTGDAGATG